MEESFASKVERAYNTGFKKYENVLDYINEKARQGENIKEIKKEDREK